MNDAEVGDEEVSDPRFLVNNKIEFRKENEPRPGKCDHRLL